MTGPIALLVADADPLVSEALGLALSRCDSIKAIDDHPRTGSDLVRAVREGQPDVALITDPLKDMKGPAAIRSALGAKSDLRVLMMGAQTSTAQIRAALEAGAIGYLPRSLDVATVAEGVRRASVSDGLVFKEQLRQLMHLVEDRGRRQGEMADRLAELTARQLDVLQLMGHGLTALQMAKHLDLAEATVRTHIHKTLEKLDVRSQVEAVAVARDLGVIT